MKLYIKSARIVDPTSSFNGKISDIFIDEGKIISIDSKNVEAPSDAIIYDAKDECISPGWFDMQANFRDPGFEYKEDLHSGCITAAYGGFTGVAVMPSTFPFIQSKAEVEYVKNKTSDNLVEVFPIGAVSNKMEGKDLVEMFDMFQTGAVAFSDDKKSIANAGLMMRALLYAKNFDGLIISYPEDVMLSGKGLMNEGHVSTQLGLRGIPSLSEEIMIARDISIAEYLDAKIHFSTISSARSVELIKKAKEKGLKVTAAVSSYQLALDESVLSQFDSNYKVKPPLRTKSDIEALREGLREEVIDVICSDHSPEDEESKKKEFEYAAFGMISLEIAFALANTHLRNYLKIDQIINNIAINPRKILNLPIPSINTGGVANFTIFNPDKEWIFSAEDIRSKSQNTPFIGSKFIGKASAVYNRGQFLKCDSIR